MSRLTTRKIPASEILSKWILLNSIENCNQKFKWLQCCHRHESGPCVASCWSIYVIPKPTFLLCHPCKGKQLERAWTSWPTPTIQNNENYLNAEGRSQFAAQDNMLHMCSLYLNNLSWEEELVGTAKTRWTVMLPPVWIVVLRHLQVGLILYVISNYAALAKVNTLNALERAWTSWLAPTIPRQRANWMLYEGF